MSKASLHKYIWALILIGVLVYFNSFFNGFVWDDEEQIINNVAIRSLANIPSFFFGSTFNTGGTGALGGVYYRPVMMIFFTILHAVTGASPFLFHFFQVMLHIGTVVLLFYLFRKFFAHHIAFFLSLIFLVHPMNVEAVSYIAAVQDVMFVFFSMVVFYIARNNEHSSSVLQACIVGMLYLLALLSKEVALLSIIIFLFYQLLYQRKRLPMQLFIFAFTGILYGFMRFALAGVYFSTFHFAPIVNMPFTGRVRMAPIIVLQYLRTFIWPDKLAVMQHWVITEHLGLYSAVSFIGIAILLACFVYFFIKTHNKGLLVFGVWFGISIAPYLQLFPLDMTVAERWFYFPMIGLLGICGFFITDLEKRVTWMRGRAITVMACVIVIGLSVRTVVRNTNWANERSLFGHDIQISRNAFDLENNYGVALFRKADYDGALIHFRRSTELAGGWWVNWNNLGAAYQRKGDLKRAVRYYKRSLENGDYYLAYENYTQALILLGKKEEAQDFLQHKALILFPYNQTLHDYYRFLSQPSQGS